MKYGQVCLHDLLKGVKVSISIITPTFNRCNLLVRSVKYSLELIKNGFADELIIVDDCSTDNTLEQVKSIFSREIETGQIIYKRLNSNVGVTAAKNYGAHISSCEWLIFMDSDDYFSVNAGKYINETILREKEFCLLFFRCIVASTSEIIGDHWHSREIFLRDIINDKMPGECLPVVRRNVFLENKYFASLRGCESICYLSILSSNNRAFLSSDVARVYELDGDDRLSNKSAIRKRAFKLAYYHFYTLRYFRHFTLLALCSKVIKVNYYLLLAIINFVLIRIERQN